MAYSIKDLYLEQYVVLYLIGMNMGLISPDGEEVKISGMVEGFVLEIDDNYMHLGATPAGVDRSIRIDSIGMIEIHQQMHEDELLAEMEDDEKDVH